MGLTFFDKNINTETKRQMVTRLENNYSSNENSKHLKLNRCDMNEIIKNEIDIFVTNDSRDFFQIL